MTQEEKAKRYDEAIEIARKIKNGEPINVPDGTPIPVAIFSELAESEDERIRKAIHIFLDWLDGRKDYAPRGEYSIRDMIAWLERQGKQRGQLINKACDLLVNCIEDFMLRRMEIWDEECKKQTLENIRKKLEE